MVVPPNKVSNLTLSNSPSWTVHFQYCDGVEVEHTTVFNPNNGSIEAPNADGMDVYDTFDITLDRFPRRFKL